MGPRARFRCCQRPFPAIPPPHPACDSHRTGHHPVFGSFAGDPDHPSPPCSTSCPATRASRSCSLGRGERQLLPIQRAQRRQRVFDQLVHQHFPAAASSQSHGGFPRADVIVVTAQYPPGRSGHRAARLVQRGQHLADRRSQLVTVSWVATAS